MTADQLWAILILHGVEVHIVPTSGVAHIALVGRSMCAMRNGSFWYRVARRLTSVNSQVEPSYLAKGSDQRYQGIDKMDVEYLLGHEL